MTTLHGIYSRAYFEHEEFTRVKNLGDICNRHDSLDLKISWSRMQRIPPADRTSNNYFVAYNHDVLVGFLGNFMAPEPELSGMVHPDHRKRGIFRSLLAAALAEGSRGGLTSYLLIVEQNAKHGLQFVRSLHPTFDHTELRMFYHHHDEREVKELSGFNFRRATTEDIETLRTLTADGFQIPLESVSWFDRERIASGQINSFLAIHDGKAVGKADYFVEEGRVGIIGVTVDETYRGKGVGRFIITHLVQEIRQTGHEIIWLEVDPETEDAVHLYEKCGFQKAQTYHYYLYSPGL